MIDLEKEIYTTLYNSLTLTYTSLTMSGTTQFMPNSFPFLCVEEADNQAYEETQDSSNIENHARVTYEVNVYSNKKTGAKAECRKILSSVDTLLGGLGFTRQTYSPIPNADPSVYRVVARYIAVVGSNKTIYRR